MQSIEIVRATGQAFYDALASAKQNGQNMDGVDLYSAAEYDGMRCYLSADELSGYAIKSDRTLISVFSTVRGRGDELVSSAVKNGATKLDCFVSMSEDGEFSGPLWTLYTRYGFKIDTSINDDGEYPIVNGVSKVEGEPAAVVYMTR